MYVKLVITVSAVDTRITSTSRLVIKTHYDSCKQSYEKKIKEFVGWSERLTTTKKIQRLKTIYLELLDLLLLALSI